MAILEQYFRGLYQRTIAEAYKQAYASIAATPEQGRLILDCGANIGRTFDAVAARTSLTPAQYRGIEWSAPSVEKARARGLDVRQGDLNQVLPFDDNTFTCIYGLSVLEHLLNPCRHLGECHRVLQPGGSLVLLTPNISTYFTAALILMGKMPSSGPNPDSNELLRSQEIFRVRNANANSQVEGDTPPHRHLVVFSYRVLGEYLRRLGFEDVRGYGYGVYPFPNFMQPLMERIDPWHCHQMVFVARKKS